MEGKTKVGIYISDAAAEFADHHGISISTLVERTLAEEMGKRIALPVIRMKAHGRLDSISRILLESKYHPDKKQQEDIHSQIAMLKRMLEALQGEAWLPVNWEELVRKGLL